MYAKVYRSLWDGTLAQGWETWATFVFMLAHADCEGFVDMTHDAIARRSCIPEDKVREAIERLEAPDSQSRSQEFEGRRLERIDAHRSWGWRIINYEHYRNLRDEDERRRQNREAQQRHRQRYRQQASAGVSGRQPQSATVSPGRGRGRGKSQNTCPPDGGRAVARKPDSLPSRKPHTTTPAGPRPEPPAGPADTNGGPGESNALTLRGWFDRFFWPRYPRKVHKGEAWKATQRLFKPCRTEPQRDALGDAILKLLAERKATEWAGRETDKLPYAATFLHKEEFDARTTAAQGGGDT